MYKEPAAIVGAATGVVTAVLAIVVAFGVDLSDDQQKAILGIVAAVAPIVAGIVIRGKVFSPATYDQKPDTGV